MKISEKDLDAVFAASFIEIQEMEKVVADTEKNLAYLKSALSRLKMQIRSNKEVIATTLKR